VAPIKGNPKRPPLRQPKRLQLRQAKNDHNYDGFPKHPSCPMPYRLGMWQCKLPNNGSKEASDNNLKFGIRA